MSAQQFHRRPVPVQAVQWTGENVEEIHEFVGNRYNDPEMGSRFVLVEDVIGVWVYPDVGDGPVDSFVHLEVGSWVIEDEHGITACTKDAFPVQYTSTNEPWVTKAELEALRVSLREHWAKVETHLRLLNREG